MGTSGTQCGGTAMDYLYMQNHYLNFIKRTVFSLLAHGFKNQDPFLSKAVVNSSNIKLWLVFTICAAISVFSTLCSSCGLMDIVDGADIGDHIRSFWKQKVLSICRYFSTEI